MLCAFISILPHLYFTKLVPDGSVAGYVCTRVWTTLTLSDCNPTLALAPYQNMTELCPSRECSTDQYSMESMERGYFIFRITFGFLLPTCLTLIFYHRIRLKIVQSSKMVTKLGTKSSIDEQSTLTRNIVIFFSATFIGNFPYILHKIAILVKLPLNQSQCSQFKRTANIFLIFSPVINGLIYSFLGRKFRKDLKVTSAFLNTNSKLWHFTACR